MKTRSPDSGPQSPALGLALAYVLAGGLWIYLSHRFAVGGYPPRGTWRLPLAEWGFVAVSALALFRYVRAAFDALAASTRRLAERDEQHRIALEAAGLGTWRHDVEAGVMHLDEVARRHYGFDEPAQTLDEVVARIHPDDLPRVRPAIAAALDPEGGGRYASEHRVVHVDGRVLWLSNRAQVFFEGEGPDRRPTFTFGATHDVTERKVYEREIERLSRLYAALSQVNQSIVRARSREELLTEVCRVLTAFGGFRMAWIGWKDPATGGVTPVAESGDETGYLAGIEITTADVPEGRGPTGTALREGRTYVCNDFFGDPNTVKWWDRAARARFRGSAAFPIALDGELVAALMVYAAEPDFFGDKEVALLEEAAMDISFALEHLAGEARRREAEEALRQSEERYRALVETSVDWVWEVDASGRYTFSSPRVRELLGYDPEEVLGLTPFDLMTPEEAARIRPFFAAAQERLLPIAALENVNAHRDGRLVVLETSAAPTFGPGGEFLGYRGIDRDVTDRKRLRSEKEKLDSQLRQAQKLEAIGTLAGGIAHDFNNILTPLIGHADLALLRAAPTDPVRENLENILRAADRARELVKQILVISRKEEGAAPTAVELGPLVKESTKFLRASLPTTIEIRTSVDPACGPVFGDLSQLHQVILNLCTNAGYAMRETGGVLTVSLERRPAVAPGVGSGGEGRAWATLTVADTGSGIDPAHLDRIFEPYFTTKPASEGSGLGLAVVHGIVSRLGGEVRVRSTPGQGTAFDVLLPEAAPGGSAQGAARPEIPRGRGEHVLLVDDEAPIRRVASKMLEALGYRVTEAVGGPEALELLRTDPAGFALVLTDYTMPERTGLELAADLQEVRPDLPVVLGTGFAQSVNEEFVRSRGLAGLLMKPYDLESLGRAVERALKGETRAALA